MMYVICIYNGKIEVGWWVNVGFMGMMVGC